MICEDVSNRRLSRRSIAIDQEMSLRRQIARKTYVPPFSDFRTLTALPLAEEDTVVFFDVEFCFLPFLFPDALRLGVHIRHSVRSIITHVELPITSTEQATLD